MVKEFCDAADFSTLDYYNDCLLNENKEYAFLAK